jgi:hypothetical protein
VLSSRPWSHLSDHAPLAVEIALDVPARAAVRVRSARAEAAVHRMTEGR